MDTVPLFDREHLMVIRKRQGLTQEELAAKAGIDHQHLAALEQGRRKNPSIRTVKAMALALGIPGHDLVPGLCGCPDQSDAA
jgi:transcriptional regulator with XRE-family HTH domain